MQQMHQGQIPGPPNPVMSQAPPSQDVAPTSYGQAQQQQPPVGPPPGMSDGSANATSLDDLISGASKQAEAAVAVANTTNAAAPPIEARTTTTKAPEIPAATEEKSSKKEKEKPKAAKLVYSDNETSAEEKMASLSRYAFTPELKRDVALGRPEGTVTGPAGGTGDVADASRGL